MKKIALALHAICLFGAFAALGQSPRWAADQGRVEFSSDLPIVLETASNISVVVGKIPATPQQRVQQAHSLGSELAENDISMLYSFLRMPLEDDGNLAVMYGLKNDVLNVLRHQTIAPEGLSDLLTQLFTNATNDSVIRDYAIQHLIAWYEDGGVGASESTAVIHVLTQAAYDKKTSIAGTALLGMHRLSKVSSEIPSKTVDRLALELASSKDSNRATRITAIQVCAERQLVALLPSLSDLPESVGSLPLRLSASAAKRTLVPHKENDIR